MISLSRTAENEGDGTLDHANRRNMTFAPKECRLRKGEVAAVGDGAHSPYLLSSDDPFDSCPERRFGWCRSTATDQSVAFGIGIVCAVPHTAGPDVLEYRDAGKQTGP